MGKASSSKKVARAARAGGNRRSGQRRNLGFPTAIMSIVVVGLLLVVITRHDRVVNAAPRVSSDHWHTPYDVYTCVPDPSTPVTPPTTAPTDSTTTTVAPAAASGSGLGLDPAPIDAGHLGVGQTPSTTAPTDTAPVDTTPAVTSTGDASTTTSTLIAQPGDVPGVFQPHFQDATTDVNGIHTHGDGVIHVHPFVSSAAGRNAQLSVFVAQVGVTLTDSELAFPDLTTGQMLTYKEGTTKCQGGVDAIVQVGLWDKVEDAANGLPPNQVITTNVADVRLKNGEALTIAFLPKDSRIPIQSDVKTRFDNLTDVAPSTTVPASTDSSGATPASSGDTTTTVPATSTSGG